MKIVCIGRNYSEHIRELNNEVPEEPVIFIKPDNALLRNNAPFYIPDFTQDVHYETELVLKITKVGKSIPVQFAADYFQEIGLGIDFTARDVQNRLKSKGLPWEKAKGFDHSAAVGTFYPKSDFDITNLNFTLQVNGQLVQQGNTQDMIHSFDAIISHVSQYFTLKKGDLIFTGTPAGVGSIKPGDRLVGHIETLPAFDFGIR